MEKNVKAKRSLAAFLAVLCLTGSANLGAFSAGVTVCAEEASAVTEEYHDWANPKWEVRSSDEIYANFKCQNCGETRRIKADIKKEEHNRPGCHTQGDEIHTATVTLDGFEFSTKYYHTLPSVGKHDCAEPVWTWSDDHSSASVALSCVRCNASVVRDAAVSSEVVTDGEDTVTVYTAKLCTNAEMFTDTVKVKNTEPTETRTASWEWTDSLTHALLTVTYGSGKTVTVPAEMTVDKHYATHLSMGWISYTAAAVVDGIKYNDVKYIPLSKNSMVHYEAEEPTCTEDGCVDHWLDLETGQYYLDPECTQPAHWGQTQITQLGHDYDYTEWHWYKDLKHAWFEAHCTRCGTMKTPAFSTKRTEENGKVIYTVTCPRTFTGIGRTYYDKKIIDPRTSIPKVTYEQGDRAVKLNWNNVFGAQQYGIAGYVNSKWKLLDTTEDTSYIIRNLKPGTEYKVAVIPMLEGEWNMNFKNALTVTPMSASTAPIQYKIINGKVGIKWKPVYAVAEKYAVAVYQANKWVIKKELDGSTTSWTTPVLAPGTYRFAVVTMVNGAWKISSIKDMTFVVTIQ